MKQYPSIPREFREIHGAYIFDKLDGSNIRIEWTKKNGWHKFGSRHRLLDESDSLLGEAKPLFLSTYADLISQVLIDNRCQHAVAFCEFWGKESFAGLHKADDPKYMTLFDVALDKKGILGPREFLKLFQGSGITPNFLGIHNWTRGFVESVRKNELPGITFEGVVGKSGNGHKLVMAKAKTQNWIDKVHEVFHGNEAEKLINS